MPHENLAARGNDRGMAVDGIFSLQSMPVPLEPAFPTDKYLHCAQDEFRSRLAQAEREICFHELLVRRKLQRAFDNIPPSFPPRSSPSFPSSWYLLKQPEMALRNLLRTIGAVGAIAAGLMLSYPASKSDGGPMDVPTPLPSAWSSPTPTYPLTLPLQTAGASTHHIAMANVDNPADILFAPVVDSSKERYHYLPENKPISIRFTLISLIIDFIPVTTGNPFIIPSIRSTRIQLTDTFVFVLAQQLSLHSMAMILSIVFFAYKALLAIWQDSSGLLRTIEELQDKEHNNEQKIAQQDQSLAEYQKQLAEKTSAVAEAEKNLQDEKEKNKDDVTELKDARLAIGVFQTRMADKCRTINVLEKDKTDASKDITLLKRRLSDACISSRLQHSKDVLAYDSLKKVEVAASKKVRELEDEIRRIPRWSDSNIAKFTNLQRSNETLQKSLNESAVRNEDTTARLADSQAANRELRLHFDAERRQKDWLEIAVDRKAEDVRAAENRHSQTSAKLTVVQGALDSANGKLDSAATDISGLEQTVAGLSKKNRDLETNDVDIRRTNAALERRVAELEAQVAESGLLADVRKEVEVLNAELEQVRGHNVSLENDISGRDESIEELRRERALAQEGAKDLGLARDNLQAQLGQATADVATAEERVATMQDEKAALLDDKAGLERRRDELMQENGRLANDLTVRSHQEEDIRAEYEQQFRVLAAQGEQWVQGIVQKANEYAQEQEQRAVTLELELHSTRTAMDNLRSLAMEFERQTLASQGVTVFPSPPITPPAFRVQELQPVQVNQTAVEVYGTNQTIPMFPSGVPQVMPALGNGSPLAGPSNGCAMTAREAPAPASQATGPNTHNLGAPQGSVSGNTTVGNPPVSGPSTNLLRARKGVRALPQKVGGRVVRLQGTPQPPQPTATSASSAAGPSQGFQPQPMAMHVQAWAPLAAGSSPQPPMFVSSAGVPFAGSSTPTTQ